MHRINKFVKNYNSVLKRGEELIKSGVKEISESEKQCPQDVLNKVEELLNPIAKMKFQKLFSEADDLQELQANRRCMFEEIVKKIDKEWSSGTKHSYWHCPIDYEKSRSESKPFGYYGGGHNGGTAGGYGGPSGGGSNGG